MRVIFHANKRYSSKHNICIPFIQGWTNVEDIGLTLYTCYSNVLCLLGYYYHDYNELNIHLRFPHRGHCLVVHHAKRFHESTLFLAEFGIALDRDTLSYIFKSETIISEKGCIT